MFSYDSFGIKLLNSQFWLDAHRKVPFSFVSHGHSDHIRNHEKILATKPTIRFHAMRGKYGEAVALDYGQVYEYEDMRIRLYPAGHILGSAMIWIERDGQSLLYTGDFKLRQSHTSEQIEIPHADILIMESTYGDPSYTTDNSISNIVEELDSTLKQCLQDGSAPIILAYVLGKAQEAMKILGDLGYAVRVHPVAWKFAQVYAEFGLSFPNCAPWRGGSLARGEILIFPPHLTRSRDFHSIRNKKTIFLSGWANGRNITNYQSDYAIPLSDHADFGELLEFVRKVNPKKVFTTHGFDDFPQHIRSIGYDAELLKPATQYSLF